MNSTVSVIIPVFNASKTLDRCIKSILEQTYKDFELILVDDGSTDNSLEICNSYSRDTRVHVYHKENEGVSKTRNYAISKVNGYWICFIDSDDYISTDFLENLVIDNSLDFIIQGYTIINADERAKVIKLNVANENWYYVCEMSNIINSPWAKLYRADIVKDNQIIFNVNTSYGEDHLFVLDYLRYCKNVRCIESVGYYYCVTENSLTNKIINEKSLEVYISMLPASVTSVGHHYKCVNQQLKNIIVCRLYDTTMRLVKSHYYHNKDNAFENNRNFLRNVQKNLSFNLKLGIKANITLLLFKVLPVKILNNLLTTILRTNETT